VSGEIDDRVAAVSVTSDALVVRLSDGRMISTPISWFPKLAKAHPAQRSTWDTYADGRGISWTDLGEQVLVADLMRVKPAAESIPVAAPLQLRVVQPSN
jgi:hypothetical protein